MSLSSFLFIALWREKGVIARTVQIVLVTVPLIAAAVVGLSGGNWSRNLWPWWVWALLTLVTVIAVLLFGITQRARFLEEAPLSLSQG